MIKSLLSLLLLAGIVCLACARTFESPDATVSAVIPSPNQFEDEYADLQRTSSSILKRSSQNSPAAPKASESQQAAPSNEASVPVYASPFARAERGSLVFDRQESSHAPPNYAPRPPTSSAAPTSGDLKASASYGHHHHGGHHGGYDHSGWLDMGAWTGGKGSFGWYADYPVGGKHHYGYGRK